MRRPNRIDSVWSRMQKSRSAVLVSVLVLVALVLLHSVQRSNSNSPLLSSSKSWDSFRPLVQFSPTVEFINNTDVISQIPDHPKAVLFIAHGCNGKAANFWDKCPTCLHCVGLPEERLIVLHALARNFAVVTISSRLKCWSIRKDREHIKWILEWWIQKNGLPELPLTALGASSGGYFVSAFATDLKFSSITIMIAEGVFESIDVPAEYPPTLFVHMPKDLERATLVSVNLQSLAERGIDVGEVKCPDFPLTPTLLSDRVPGIEMNVSISIYEVFKEKGVIDEKGYMKGDGRNINWMQHLKDKEIISDEYQWHDHIQEELNLAFGYHEMTSLPAKQIFGWFESHLNRRKPYFLG